MKTILALIDFSDVTPKLLHQAQALSLACGGSVVLIHVMPPWPVAVDFAPPPSGDDFHTRQNELFALRDTLAARGVEVTAQQFEGSVLEVLLDQIDLHVPDLVIMGSHGHGALYNLMVGSVTAGVLKHAACPVLLVPSSPEAHLQPVASQADIEAPSPIPVPL